LKQETLGRGRSSSCASSFGRSRGCPACFLGPSRHSWWMYDELRIISHCTIEEVVVLLLRLLLRATPLIQPAKSVERCAALFPRIQALRARPCLSRRQSRDVSVASQQRRPHTPVGGAPQCSSWSALSCKVSASLSCVADDIRPPGYEYNRVRCVDHDAARPLARARSFPATASRCLSA